MFKLNIILMYRIAILPFISISISVSNPLRSIDYVGIDDHPNWWISLYCNSLVFIATLSERERERERERVKCTCTHVCLGVTVCVCVFCSGRGHQKCGGEYSLILLYHVALSVIQLYMWCVTCTCARLGVVCHCVCVLWRAWWRTIFRIRLYHHDVVFSIMQLYILIVKLNFCI
jgi:hypothetical protein